MAENEQGCCPEEELILQTQISEDVIVDEISEEEKELQFLLDKENRSQERLDICKSCDNLMTPMNMCNQCYCFMNIKVRIYSATCPIGKW